MAGKRSSTSWRGGSSFRSPIEGFSPGRETAPRSMAACQTGPPPRVRPDSPARLWKAQAWAWGHAYAQRDPSPRRGDHRRCRTPLLAGAREAPHHRGEPGAGGVRLRGRQTQRRGAEPAVPVAATEGQGWCDDRGIERAGGRRLRGLPSSRPGSAIWSACSVARQWRTRSSRTLWPRRRHKKDAVFAVAADGRVPVSRVAESLGVSWSQLHARASGISKSRGGYSTGADAELLPAIRRPVDPRPTYGYRRIAALLNRKHRIAGLEPV